MKQNKPQNKPQLKPNAPKPSPLAVRGGEGVVRADSSAVGGLDEPQSVRQSVELLTQSESTG